MDVNKFSAEWQSQWEKSGYTTPTAIQQHMYEPIKSGENILGVSPTGTGKTLAYLLPLFEKIKAGAGNQLLVLLPSQELAMQVTEVARLWLESMALNVQPVIGQANINRQIERLKEKPEVLVGTPGRVYELVQQKKIKAHLLKTVVLDEVDQLLEHSELNAAQNILKRLQQETQLIGISATGKNIEAMFTDLIRKEILLIDVTKEMSDNLQVIHAYLRLPLRKRSAALRSLAHVRDMRAIVFFNEVSELGAVAEKMTYDGIPNVTLASDQSKFERQGAIRLFQEKKVPFLLTTDLGARGLDFQDVGYVIHYDIPYEQAQYLHRSGRTGRMNQAGTVLTFLSNHQEKDLKKVSSYVKEGLQEMFLFGGELLFEKPEPTKHKVVNKKTKHKKKKKKR
ncbi:DEAD/DEAH box helicase [Vagococcus elongatus]|uniref:RNA helicase n=1 Tax=Vagococcus elongatus TaxID=180344 RepID=A0A430B436_9ENTE|nr:DEAD/DEAH box helicase [Vagococcus elongatus]RSU15100.1 hypothetical protein CBF29_01850 [Vagococcus elongatus]